MKTSGNGMNSRQIRRLTGGFDFKQLNALKSMALQMSDGTLSKTEMEQIHKILDFNSIQKHSSPFSLLREARRTIDQLEQTLKKQSAPIRPPVQSPNLKFGTHDH